MTFHSLAPIASRMLPLHLSYRVEQSFMRRPKLRVGGTSSDLSDMSAHFIRHVKPLKTKTCQQVKVSQILYNGCGNTSTIEVSWTSSRTRQGLLCDVISYDCRNWEFAWVVTRGSSNVFLFLFLLVFTFFFLFIFLTAQRAKATDYPRKILISQSNFKITFKTRYFMSRYSLFITFYQFILCALSNEAKRYKTK